MLERICHLLRGHYLLTIELKWNPRVLYVVSFVAPLLFDRGIDLHEIPTLDRRILGLTAMFLLLVEEMHVALPLRHLPHEIECVPSPEAC